MAKHGKAHAKRHAKAPRPAKRNPLDDPNQLTRPLTPRMVNTQTAAAVRAKFGPQTLDLQAQQRASDQQQQNIGNWYDQYKRDLADSLARTAAAYNNAGAQITGANQQATASDTAQQQQIQTAAQSDAANRGTRVDPLLAATSQQAIAARTAASNRDLASTATIGANAQSLAASRIPIAQEQAIGAHNVESGRRRTINQSLSQLKGQKSDYGIGLRQAAHTTAVNEQIAVQAGLLKQRQVDIAQQNANATSKNANTNAKLGSSLAHDRTEQRLIKKAHDAQIVVHQNRQDKTAQQRADDLAAKNAADLRLKNWQRKYRTGPFAKPKGSKESARSMNARASIVNITGEYQRLLTRFHGDHGKVAHRLRGGKHPVGDLFLNAAADRAATGKISAGHAAALRAVGVRIPNSWVG